MEKKLETTEGKNKNPKKAAHPSLHSDSKKFGIDPQNSDNKPTNIKRKAHRNYHLKAKKN